MAKYTAVRCLALSAPRLQRAMPAGLNFPHLVKLTWLVIPPGDPRRGLGADVSLAHAFVVLTNLILSAPVLKHAELMVVPNAEDPATDLAALKRLLARRHQSLQRLLLPWRDATRRCGRASTCTSTSSLVTEE